MGIGEGMLYNTNYSDKFPVNITENDDDDDSKYDTAEIKDTVDYKQHPQYELFLVRDHPFITKSKIENNKIPMIRSLIWQKHNNSVLLLNQRIIPQKFGTVQCKTYKEMSKNIKIMTIRGAPAIGAATGYGMALAALEFYRENSNTNPPPTQFVEFMRS